MPRALPGEQEAEPTEDASRSVLIGRQVIRALGTPKDLLKVRVHPVGADHFRVNIVTGKDYPSSRITNSFFLTTDPQGQIVRSIPAIQKIY